MEELNPQQSVREELQFFERLLRDPAFADNALLPQMQRLLVLTWNLDSKCDKLTKENKQLMTQTVDFNRSVDLATRIDPLTRLANRRDIMERLIQEESRSQRHRRAFSVILVNVDDLARINEVHGRHVGDELLVEIACELQHCVRSEDVCGRWRGDEFMFLLPETELEGAVSVAEKVVKSVAMTEFRFSRQGLRTTVSVGIGEYRPDQSVHEFVATLDRAVRQAQLEGKNRYVIV